MLLTDIFPDFDTMRSVEPEELAGAILEMIPTVNQGGGFLIDALVDPAFMKSNPKAFPGERHGEAKLIVAEAVSWLCNQGLAIRDPQQLAAWYRLTRRGAGVRNRQDLDAFRRGRILPRELLQPHLAEKVQHLFLRGDHDTAVFQSFKEVEVAVRNASNDQGAGYADDLVGMALMQKAFHAENGPLRNASAVSAERQSEMFLFTGAMGHAKNPTSHRDVKLEPQEAVRLIVFASYLLQLVDDRKAMLSRQRVSASGGR